MNQRRVFFVIVISAAAVCMFLASCSELKKELPTQSVVSSAAHSAGWNDTTSAAFHGKTLKTGGYDFSSCVTCHGTTFAGGTSRQSCYECHGSFPHGSGWGDNESSPAFHGKFVKALAYNVETCKPCHGQNFAGGTSGVSCAGSECHNQAYPHTSGWSSEGSANFHGTYLRTRSYNTADCVSCHGSNLLGGSSGVSCKQCHTTYPHVSDWVNPASTAYHGKYLKDKSYNATECTACHGTDYKGAGVAGKSCYQCHTEYPHAAAWTTAGSPQSHGQYLKAANWNDAGCKSCHGTNYAGGTSGISCFTCHASYPHTTSWMNASSGQSHGDYLKTKTWNLTECQVCHGANYAGGAVNVSCYTCHGTYPHAADVKTGHPAALRTAGYPLDQCQMCHGAAYAGGTIANVSCMTSGCHRDGSNNPKSPEACNTCHGDFLGAANDATSWASTGGAHAKHIKTNTIGAAVQCQECHTVPTAVFASGHLGTDNRAEVTFGGPIALTRSDSGRVVPSPTYNTTTLTCSNTYCHGNWRLRKSMAGTNEQAWYSDILMVGANASPAWTGGPPAAACGTCHTNPPTGHTNFNFTISACASCHQGIIDGNGNFIDKSKHVSGKINVFGSESTMR